MIKGTKGPRMFDWAVMPMMHRCANDGRLFLLIRRCVDDPSEKAYYFVFAPLGTTLVEMVQAIGQRWKIEECFEIGKGIGLEDYEVRSFTAWYRHITLVMLVQACLAGICAATRMPPAESPPQAGTSCTCPLLPLTIPARPSCSCLPAQAQMSLHAHPSDARIKCLTSEQVFVLANLHNRVLQTAVPAAFACSTPSEAESQKPLLAADAELRARLAQMEAQIATLQTQLT